MTQVVVEEKSFSGSGASVPDLGFYRTGASLYLSGILYSVPLVCFTGAALADLTYVKAPNIQWSNFSAWLLAFGIFFLGLAIVASIIRFFVTVTRKRGPVDWLYSLTILAAAVVGLFDNFVHSHDGWTSVWPNGLMLSAIAALLIFIAMLLKLARLSNTYVVEAK